MLTVLLIFTIILCERVKILNLLGEFHNKGRLHLTDFAERNVVVRDGRYRLIDFHDIEDHSCDWCKDMDWQVGHFWLEAQRKIPCDILGELGDEMGIWSDRTFSKCDVWYRSSLSTILADPMPVVEIHGRSFPASDFPPQKVINKLMPKNFLGVPQNWEWADTYFRQVKKDLDEDPKLDIQMLLVNRPKLPF